MKMDNDETVHAHPPFRHRKRLVGSTNRRAAKIGASTSAEDFQPQKGQEYA